MKSIAKLDKQVTIDNIKSRLKDPDFELNPADANAAIYMVSKDDEYAYDYVNVFDHDNWVIRWACVNGYIALIKYLLTLPEVDPAAKNNDAIRHAAINGHAKIVELLLSDPRVDPTAADNDALESAILNSDKEVKEVLFKNNKVKSSYYLKYGFQ
jgi:hypothetical protein